MVFGGDATRRGSDASPCDHSCCASDSCMRHVTCADVDGDQLHDVVQFAGGEFQTRCFIPNVPGPPPSLSAPGSAPAIGLIFNADANATCRMGCTSTQLSCQSGCALNSPSQ